MCWEKRTCKLYLLVSISQAIIWLSKRIRNLVRCAASPLSAECYRRWSLLAERQIFRACAELRRQWSAAERRRRRWGLMPGTLRKERRGVARLAACARSASCRKSPQRGRRHSGTSASEIVIGSHISSHFASQFDCRRASRLFSQSPWPQSIHSPAGIAWIMRRSCPMGSGNNPVGPPG